MTDAEKIKLLIELLKEVCEAVEWANPIVVKYVELKLKTLI